MDNNYKVLVFYFNDFFYDTDCWYVVVYSFINGWVLEVSTVSGSIIMFVVNTVVRIIIYGNVIVLVVSASEFSVSEFEFWLMVFCYIGDWGIQFFFDYDGSFWLVVVDGLESGWVCEMLGDNGECACIYLLGCNKD